MPLDSTGSGRPERRPEPRNVLGGTLQTCSMQPLTGFHRDGLLRHQRRRSGQPHGLCDRDPPSSSPSALRAGNDLGTPMPAFGFPGLQPGDRWCLCAPRWQEAFLAGKAPQVVLEATEIGALDHCELDDLKRHQATGA